jgi:D-cysteine desulfhydrase family pyridoxal phosphate-dependent enzyme
MNTELQRIPLAHLPTPVESLPRLSAHLGGPELWVKRDDQTGLAFGGNKTRKLEYLLAEARAEGARTLVTAGALQSNHCRQTAAAAARFGMGCRLVLNGVANEKPSGNLLLDQLLGASITLTSREKRGAEMERIFEEALAAGEAPFMIPYGGSNATGAVAYAFALHEMQQQGLEPDWIVFPSSSGGTQAGLLAGATSFGFTGKILGISIEDDADTLKKRVAHLAGETLGKMGGQGEDDLSERILVDDSYLGRGYGVMDEPEIEAIRLLARTEGLLVDPVYTGRAAAGLIDLIRKGLFNRQEKVLFWHTGGTPALLAEKYQVRLQGSDTNFNPDDNLRG